MLTKQKFVVRKKRTCSGSSTSVKFESVAKLGSNVPISGASTVLTMASFTKEITSPSGADEVDNFSVSSGRMLNGSALVKISSFYNEEEDGCTHKADVTRSQPAELPLPFP